MATKKTVKKNDTKAQKPKLRREVKDDIFAVCFFALSALLMLSVYVNLLGPFGGALRAFTRAAFGRVRFALPFISLWLGIGLVRKNRKITGSVRLWTALFLTVSLSGVCYLFEGGGYFGSYGFTEFFTKCIPDMVNRTGGVVGGIFAYPLICLLTRVGFAIIIITVTLICALTFFDVTLNQIWRAIRGADKKEKLAVKDEPEVVKPIIQKPKKKNRIDIFVDEDESGAEAEPEEIFVTPDDVGDGKAEYAEGETIPFFVHDDIRRDRYIAPAEAFGAEPEKEPEKDSGGYGFPPMSLLKTPPRQAAGVVKTEIEQNEKKLIDTLRDFGIEATTIGATVGPIVTRYEIAPSKGVRVSRITSLSDDIALALAAQSIRIEAPIPGKAAVGIEIPNRKKSMVYIKELLESPEFTLSDNPLTVALGKDISGAPVFADLSDMPHLLVAGATGSGKSVCINTILMSLLYKASPDEVKLILIDPKVVELEVYNKIPHLIVPIVSNPKKAAGALLWAVNEMERRYSLFSGAKVRDLGGYNAHASKQGEDKLPSIVIVIDELADLMMVCGKEVEDYIVRLCQKARAAGLYLIIATQRPSVKVVTGLIKANVPSRIAFAVASQIDSRVILDGAGAEKLLGKGDMLFKGRTMNAAQRVQCCFVSDAEVEAATDYIRRHCDSTGYDENANAAMESYISQDKPQGSGEGEDEELDDMFWETVRYVIETGKASTSNLQRKFSLGYARAARIIDCMEEKGIIGPYEGAKPREVLMTMGEYQEAMVKRD